MALSYTIYPMASMEVQVDGTYLPCAQNVGGQWFPLGQCPSRWDSTNGDGTPRRECITLRSAPTIHHLEICANCHRGSAPKAFGGPLAARMWFRSERPQQKFQTLNGLFPTCCRMLLRSLLSPHYSLLVTPSVQWAPSLASASSGDIQEMYH